MNNWSPADCLPLRNPAVSVYLLTVLTDVPERPDVLGLAVGVGGAVGQVDVDGVLGAVLERVHRVRHPAEQVLCHRDPLADRRLHNPISKLRGGGNSTAGWRECGGGDRERPVGWTGRVSGAVNNTAGMPARLQRGVRKKDRPPPDPVWRPLGAGAARCVAPPSPHVTGQAANQGAGSCRRPASAALIGAAASPPGQNSVQWEIDTVRFLTLVPAALGRHISTRCRRQ